MLTRSHIMSKKREMVLFESKKKKLNEVKIKLNSKRIHPTTVVKID